MSEPSQCLSVGSVQRASMRVLLQNGNKKSEGNNLPRDGLVGSVVISLILWEQMHAASGS